MVNARFRRLLNTGDQYDHVIIPSKNFLLSYALGGRF
jgi:hypothetical protein